MSLLLVAVLVPVQAAGCCRLAAVLGVLPGPVDRPAGPPLPADESAYSGASAGGGASAAAAGTGHACCPRKAAASADAAAAADALPASAAGAAEPGEAGGHCGPGSRDGSDGCCLEGSPQADPGLVSAESGPGLLLASRPQPAEEPLPAAPSLPALALPADSGPPLYLACRRLLI